MKPGIKDVAKVAGVSPTTVSRVLNNRGYISEETRKKVYDAMEEINRLFFNKLVNQNEQLNVDAMRKIFPMSETWCYWGSIMEDIGEPERC